MAKVFNVVTDGNSLTSGTLATDPNTTGYPPVLRDSLIASQASHLNAYWAVKSTGVSGATTTTRTAMFPTEVQPLYNIAYAANIVVFFEAVNDFVTNNASVAQAFTNYQTYVAQARAGGWKVLLCTSTPTTNTGNSANTRVPQFNTLLRANATLSDLPLLDLAVHPNLDDPTDSTFFQPDGLHLKDAGYATIADLVEDRLTALGDVTVSTLAKLKRLVDDFDKLEVANNALWVTRVTAITNAFYERMFQGSNADRRRFRYMVYGWDNSTLAVVYADLLAAYGV